MIRRNPWIAAALAAASLAILCAAPAQYLGRQQDDLLYIIASRALAESGYRLFITPGQPPITMIMPGFPVLLLPVTWLCGECYAAYQAFCALILAGLPWLLWWWLRKRLGEAESVLLALVFATNPVVLSQAGTVMSEGAYTALAVLLLAALDAGGGPAAGGLLLALTQVRPAGFSLLPAVLARPWRDRDWRAACWSLLPAMTAALLWYGWCLRASGEIGEFHELRFSYEGQPWLHPLAVACDNARYYLRAWGASCLPRRLSSWAWLSGAILAALCLRGLPRLWRNQAARPALLMLAGAAIMHAFWAWQYDRYLIPLLPWLLWLAAAGAGRGARWLLGALLCLQIAFQSRLWVPGRADLGRPELQRTYAWLLDHSAPSDALASPLYVRDGFHVRRPSLPLPDTADAGRFADSLKRRRARFALWQRDLDVGLSLGRTANLQRKLDRTLAHLEDRRRFRLVHEEPAEGSRIYEIR